MFYDKGLIGIFIFYSPLLQHLKQSFPFIIGNRWHQNLPFLSDYLFQTTPSWKWIYYTTFFWLKVEGWLIEGWLIEGWLVEGWLIEGWLVEGWLVEGGLVEG
ncbi:hypothetical protein [Moorena producens]|uniref:hypothetical protein n=1 Tax=Moorena producens TaxID=1155739 RepID=UPI0010555E6A|nr:hypothetical protein [Moorena producens]